MKKPKATETTRVKPKTFFNPIANKRQKGHSEEQVTTRTAHCGDPKRPPSTNFVGINVHGWIFRCKGEEQVQPDLFAPTGLSTSEHVFIAEPAS